MQHFAQNPYPPPPPPVAHKVWILDCKSCGLFLTNRAMKAVLLLRPNVPLFSSDASPVNCSAYSPDADGNGGASNCRPAPSRTCDCLTQTLCCHGCGNPVGYMIVTPCTRCTSSVSTSNRATNGHRFVFHSSEITGTERHYIPGEPGVNPFEPVSFVNPIFARPSQRPRALHPTSIPFQHPYLHSDQPAPNDFNPAPGPEYPPRFAGSPPAGYQAPPPPQTIYHASQPYAYVSTYGGYSRPPMRSPPGSFSSPPHTMNSPDSTPPALVEANLPFDPKDFPQAPRRLEAGDLVFWHHLTQGGEVPCAKDDRRARRPRTAPSLSENALDILFDR